MNDAVTVLRPHPTLSALRGGLLVLEAAERAGLPIPTYLSASSYGAVTYGMPTDVSWQPDSLDDLRAWADYLGEPIQPVPNGGTVQHRLDGTAFDQRVSLCFIEDVAGVSA